MDSQFWENAGVGLIVGLVASLVASGGFWFWLYQIRPSIEISPEIARTPVDGTSRVGVRVAHYPPYASKYNPIEHRLFPHLTRACRGVILRSVGVMKQLLEKARTATGLRVVVQVLDKVYQTGRKYTEGFKENNRICFDAFLPKWNYRVVPATA